MVIGGRMLKDKICFKVMLFYSFLEVLLSFSCVNFFACRASVAVDDVSLKRTRCWVQILKKFCREFACCLKSDFKQMTVDFWNCF